MGLPSDGDYGVPEDVMFGVPVTCSGGEYIRVKGLPMDEFAKSRLAITLKELTEERDAVAELLK
jgi:malate dehydrogenase